MAHDDRISLLVREAQKRIFRLAERDQGLSLKAIHLDSGIPYNSIRGYASGETIMAIPAMLKLVGVIPDELLSQLLEPVSKCIADTGTDDGDHDTLASNCIDFASRTARARHPDSPGGVEIVPSEDKELRQTRRQLRAKA